MGRYRHRGSAGIEDNTSERIKNSQKIKGAIAEYLVTLLEKKEARPSYEQAAKLVKKRYKVSLSTSRIGSWWRTIRKDKLAQSGEEPTQQLLLMTPIEAIKPPEEASDPSVARQEGSGDEENDGDWQINVVAGCFIL